MVEDKFASDYRTQKETNDTYVYPDKITDEELKTKVNKHYETKNNKEIISHGDYFWYPIQFTSKQDGKNVQMVYRFVSKDKAEAKANSGGGGNKQWAPKKEYVRSYKEIIEVDLHDYQAQQEEEAKGKVMILAQDLGHMMINETEGGSKYVYYGKPYKVEL